MYRALQSGTMAFANEKVSGSKIPKDRLTALICVNMNGSEKDTWVIGKFEKPRCFSNVKNLPLQYYNNKNSWMTNKIWTDILMKMNNKFERQNRHIILFVDNATCHNCEIPTPFIKLIYLPPNTTSIIQPCDQGIIRTLKAHFRRQLDAVEKGVDPQEFSKSISILDAMFMLKRALFLVTPATIVNCFRKGKFILDENEIEDESHLEEESEEFQNFVDIDKLIPTSGELTDEEICEEIRSTVECVDETEEDETQPTEMNQISYNEGREAMHKFRNFLQHKYSDMNFDTMSFAHLEEIVEQDAVAKCKQVTLLNYFHITNK
jgi:hypothetical protein